MICQRLNFFFFCAVPKYFHLYRSYSISLPFVASYCPILTYFLVQFNKINLSTEIEFTREFTSFFLVQFNKENVFLFNELIYVSVRETPKNPVHLIGCAAHGHMKLTLNCKRFPTTTRCHGNLKPLAPVKYLAEEPAEWIFQSYSGYGFSPDPRFQSWNLNFNIISG